MLAIKEALLIINLIVQMITGLGMTVESTEIHGYPEQIYTVKANLDLVDFDQRLSFDQIYGFQKISEMAKVNEIGINGMFYNDIGQPAGIIIVDGELVKKQSIDTPVFTIGKNGDLNIQEVSLKTFIEYKGKDYESFELNEGLTNTLLGVFTPWYGEHNRRFYEHTTILVEEGLVVKVTRGVEPIDIPNLSTGINEDTFMLCYEQLRYDFDVSVGDKLTYRIETDLDYENIEEAFQTGGWLVQDGVNVAKDYENYIGIMTALQPRTVMGITEDNKLIVKVVDGRNTGVSVGLSGTWIADLLIEDGCSYGVILDGGASSTVVSMGQVINQPSAGYEKEVSHGLFFRRGNFDILN